MLIVLIIRAQQKSYERPHKNSATTDMAAQCCAMRQLLKSTATSIERNTSASEMISWAPAGMSKGALAPPPEISYHRCHRDRVGGYYAVQGHPRSLIWVPNESHYATSY